MKIFVIHSGADNDRVQGLLDILKKETVSTEILMLKDGGKLWKADSRKKIKLAQLVLVFLGENTYNSKNVGWEINCAKNYGKQIVSIRLEPQFERHPALTGKNKYTGDEYPIDLSMSFAETLAYIQDHTCWDYSLFNHEETDEADLRMLFEQYKVFLQTSETLVARRQSVSNFYISVNAALISIYSAVVALAGNTKMKLVAGMGLPLMGIVLCLSWIRSLRSDGNLNASKMRIISIIEKKLPASLYDAEWRVQSDRLNSVPYVSFTESEVRIPKMFLSIYTVILLVCSAALVYNVFL